MPVSRLTYDSLWSGHASEAKARSRPLGDAIARTLQEGLARQRAPQEQGRRSGWPNCRPAQIGRQEQGDGQRHWNPHGRTTRETRRDDQQFMKALVYGGPGTKSLELRAPTRRVQSPGDAIVKMVKTTICGTDLHILKGDVPTCEPGRILGHEGVGVVEEVGAGRDQLQARRPGADLLHLGRRHMRILPQRHVLALRQRRLDSRQHRSTAPRRNMCASRTPTPASIPSPRRG